MARNLMEFAKVGYIQIEAGRIGGLTLAYAVARDAEQRGVTYVNHTFTTPLALSASLQTYAGLEHCRLCEFPAESSQLAKGLTEEKLAPDNNGRIEIPDQPGLGMTVNLATLRRFLMPVEIRVKNRVLYQTPQI